MLRRIAGSSMDQLAAFLTSPEVAPSTPNTEPRMALAGNSDYSPEAAGIFRIFQAHADPAPIDAAGVPAATAAGPVPLPPRRPACAEVGPGNADPGGRKSLSQRLIHPVQKLAHNVWTRIASPCPPCYDLRACTHDPEKWAPVFGQDHA